MIKCPRCGFSQPKDKYCAQCGVDIENYQAPTTPVFKKLMNSTFLQVSVVGALIIFIAIGLIQRNKGLSERVNTLGGSLPLIPKKNFFSNSPPTPSQPSEEANGTSEGFTESSSSPSDEINNSDVKLEMKADSVESIPNTTPESPPSRIKFSYYELNLVQFEALIDDSRSTGQYNSFRDYIAGVLTQAHNRLPKSAQLLTETKTLTKGPLTWFLGLQSTNTENNVGLRHTVEIEAGAEPNMYRVNFEIQKSCKELGENNGLSIQKTTFPVQFEMNASMGAFVAGILNAKSPMENEEYLASIPPFGILKSTLFRQSQSNFVIILELEK